jgi:DNA-binding CsgD family transcriptional regulator
LERLTLRDLHDINVFLAGLYECSDLPALRRRLLTTLQELVPADRVSLIEFGGSLDGVVGECAPAGAFADDLVGLHRRHLPQSPLVTGYRRGDGSAITYSDFLTQRQLRQLALYTDYLRRLDIEYVVAKGLPGPTDRVTTLVFDRKLRDFSARDRQVLNVLGPHLNHSYRNAVAATASRERIERMEDGIDALGRGLVLLGVDGTMQWMSSGAREWFGAYFESRGDAVGPLPEPVARWLRAHGKVSGELPEPREPLVVTRAHRQLIVRFVSRGAGALLVVEEQYLSIPPDVLRALGLTRRETEVLAWVAEGKTSDEIATILGVGRRAIEKHLEHIYPKLGVETRTAAAARALACLSAR